MEVDCRVVEEVILSEAARDMVRSSLSKDGKLGEVGHDEGTPRPVQLEWKAQGSDARQLPRERQRGDSDGCDFQICRSWRMPSSLVLTTSSRSGYESRQKQAVLPVQIYHESRC